MTTQDQVNEILAILGTDPEGVYANIRVRLDILEARINNPLAPAPNTTNPFYIDGYGGTSISVGDGYPTESRNNGSLYLRRDGSVTEGLYQVRSSVWELISGGGSSSVHNSLAGLQGGTTDEYYHLTSAGYTWLNDGYVVGYWDYDKGGTGLTSYTTGDILYASASNTLSKLPVSTDGYVLTLSSGVPIWQEASGGTSDHNLLSNLQGGETDGYYHLTPAQHTWLTDGYTAGSWDETKGGTGQTSYTTGDILYASASNTLSKLPAGSNTQVLTMNSGVPSWQETGSSYITWFGFAATRYSDGYFYVSSTMTDELTYLMRAGMPVRYGDSLDLSDGYYAIINSVAGATTTFNGTASAGTSNSITFETDVTSAVVDQIIEITGGTGSGQKRRAVSLATYTVTVDTNWSVTPDATSTYQTYPTAGIAGPPISTDHDGYFQYSTNAKISLMTLFLQNNYAASASTTLLSDIIGMNTLWLSPVAHLVKFDVYNKTNDSGASKPHVNVILNSNAVSTSNSNEGIEVSTVHTSTTTDINVSNYTVQFNEEIEVSTDAAGTNDDAADLTISLVFVIE